MNINVEYYDGDMFACLRVLRDVSVNQVNDLIVHRQGFFSSDIRDDVFNWWVE